MADNADRRERPRYAVSAAAEALEPRSNMRLTGRATDLGMGGCYVDTISPFAVGTAIRVRLFSERHCFQTRAMVTYALTGMGMGLAFSETSPDQSASLRHWVAELSGETMPHSELDSEGALHSGETRGQERQFARNCERDGRAAPAKTPHYRDRGRRSAAKALRIAGPLSSTSPL